MAASRIPLDLPWRRQPNKWTCGPAALRHALLCYGAPTSVRRIAKLAGTLPTEGTSASALQSTARELGYDLAHVASTTPELVRSNLLSYSRRGIPVICITERWQHWVCVIRSDARCVTLIDSQRDEDDPVRVYTWRGFLNLACMWLPPNETEFHIYPLLQRSPSVANTI